MVDPKTTASRVRQTHDDLELLIAYMARVGACWSPSFSPDSTRIAFVATLSGLPQVWVCETKGGWPRLVTALDGSVAKVNWSPDGNWLAFSLAPSGGMNSQVYVVHPDGTGLRLLTYDGVENNWLGPWTHDSSALCITSNLDDATAMNAYLIDVSSGEWERLTSNTGVSIITDVNRDNRQVVLNHVRNRGDNNLYLLDLVTKKMTLLTPHEGSSWFDGGRFSPDGQTVYLSSDNDRELAALAKVELDLVGEPRPLQILSARDDAELSSFAISEDGNSASLVWNVSGRSELTFLELRSGDAIGEPQLPMEIIYSAAFSGDNTMLAIDASSSTRARDIWILECKPNCMAKLPRQLTFSSHPGVNLEELVKPQLVHFSAHDGLELTGWLYVPATMAVPGPVVLSFHGGPEAQERPEFNSMYQALLSQGIGVFAPNVRGSSGFGKTFANLDNGSRRSNAIRDIRSCVDYLVSHCVANPNSIGIMGESYGGYMVMAGLTEYPECFAAGVNVSGIVNFETFFAYTEPWMAEISKAEYGDPLAESEILHSLSPIHNINRVAAPVLVVHGVNDTNVPLVEAKQVIDSLNHRGIPVKYLLFQDEGHGIKKTENRVRAIDDIVRWFVIHLRDGV